MSARYRLVPALVALAAVAALVAVLAAHGGGHTSARSSGTASEVSGFDGAALPAGVAPAFTLEDQRGRSVSLSGLRGRVVLLTFSYSTCGAPCILIAQQVRGALDELSTRVPAVLIVSADPRADSRQSVARFLAAVSLSGRAEYLAGPPSRLPSVWRAYDITPASVNAKRFKRLVSLLLIDRSGRERVLFDGEVLTPEALAHDIRKLESG